jgi:hypothetical protein
MNRLRRLPTKSPSGRCGFRQNVAPMGLGRLFCLGATKMPPRWGWAYRSATSMLPKCRPDRAWAFILLGCYQNVAPMGLGVSVGNVDPTKNAAPMGLNVLVGRGVRAFLSPSGATFLFEPTQYANPIGLAAEA